MYLKKVTILTSLSLALYLTQASNIVSATTGFAGGSGTKADPYLIETPEHLNQIRLLLEVDNASTTNKYFKLLNDLDFSTYDTDDNPDNGNWTPIGTATSPFRGDFNGGHHVIRNLKMNLPETDYVGLFGSMAGTTTVSNLGIEGARIIGNRYVGSIAGYANIALSEVFSTGYVESKTAYVGGITGKLGKTITNSYSTATISGTGNLGGIAGELAGGTVTKSFYHGILNLPGDLSKCGGLVGNRVSGTVSNSYWNTETSGLSAAIGGNSSNTATGLLTQEMKGDVAQVNMPALDWDTVFKLHPNHAVGFVWEPERVAPPTGDIVITGDIQPLLLSVTLPTEALEFTLDPNQEAEQQFIAPVFEISNNSSAPLGLKLKSFTQTTDVLTDVLPDTFDDWSSLSKEDSKQIALALSPEEGPAWVVLNEAAIYVSDSDQIFIGAIKPHQSASFTFTALHGSTFIQKLKPAYELTFIFELYGAKMNDL